jgi:hypothetical protein
MTRGLHDPAGIQRGHAVFDPAAEDPFWRWTSPEDIRLAKRSYQLAADLRTIRKAGSDAMVSLIRSGAELTIVFDSYAGAMERIEGEANYDLGFLLGRLLLPTLREQFDHLDPQGEEL